MKNGSFFVPADKIANFVKIGRMNAQEGIYAAWQTKMEVLEKVLPKPLVPIAPIVQVYIVNIQNPTFTSRYGEGAIAVPVTCNGVPGAYFFSFLLDGPGAQMGTVLGRECLGIPKKLASKILVERAGDQVTAYIERHGIRLITIEMEVGQYNNPAAKGIFNDPAPDSKESLDCIFYKYDIVQDEKGKMNFVDGRVTAVQFDVYHKMWEPGTAKIAMQPSFEDPWAELEVVEVLGAGWAQRDIDLCVKTRVLTKVDATEAMQYLYSARFDRGAINEPEKRYTTDMA